MASIPWAKEFPGSITVCDAAGVILDMNRDGTGHCDMFSKLLNDETIIVGQYATAADRL